MEILIVPDKFKTTLTSRQVSEALADGLRESCPSAEIQRLAVSDGGEGFLDTMEQAEKLDRLPVTVPGPSGVNVSGFLGVSRDKMRVFIESCQATGFHLLPEGERNPLRATSAGLAALLKAALKLSPKEIIIGLGSSATCDAGLPAAREFGYRFFGRDGEEVIGRPLDLPEIEKVRAPASLPFHEMGIRIYAVADVDNPPVGEHGGVRVYSPQKGATPEEVEFLERGMARLVSVLEKLTKHPLRELKGGGAAGNLALGLHVFFGASIVSGSSFVFEKLDLERRIKAADAVITGEGSFDEQSFYGKITGRILDAARRFGKRTFLVTGRQKVPAAVAQNGVTCFSIEEVPPKGGQSPAESSVEILKLHGRTIGRSLR